jgi:hypothetical protein
MPRIDWIKICAILPGKDYSIGKINLKKDFLETGPASGPTLKGGD